MKFPSQKHVAADAVDQLRQRVADFRDRYGFSWGDIAEQSGYGRANDGHLCNFANGRAGMRKGRFDSLTDALDRFPQGWPEPSGRVWGVKVAPLNDCTKHTNLAGEQRAAEAFLRTELMRAEKTVDGIPSPLNREAWEAYWLSREAPGFDGRKHRATPLSRQVA